MSDTFKDILRLIQDGDIVGFSHGYDELTEAFQHAAAVVGDTVGDPLKDVAGPSILIFMKLMGMAALLVAPLLMK